MNPDTAPQLLLPVVDWLALLAVLAGALLGSAAGLARAFAFLLWTLAGLWLGAHLSARLVDWMPNAVDPADPASRGTLQTAAFAVIALVVLVIPVAGRFVGGGSGRKKSDTGGTHKPFGALIGLVIALLLVTLLLPFMRRAPWLGEHWQQAAAPVAGAAVAGGVPWLFPDGHGEAVRGSG